MSDRKSKYTQTQKKHLGTGWRDIVEQQKLNKA